MSEPDPLAPLAGPPKEKGRAARVRKNLRRGMALAWTASPQALIRYTVLGIISAALPPVTVYLGAALVNRIAAARLHALQFNEVLPIVIGLWLATGFQRALGAYTGYGRNLFVRRVQLEAERRLLEQASKVDLGHFDNSDWHDRLARAKRDVSWRPGDLTWTVLGLSGNIVTIGLMAGLLLSLHWLLVVLALAAAGLSLLLERRVTSKLYEFFYKETPEEREREYLADLLVQPRSTKEIRAYVVARPGGGGRNLRGAEGSPQRPDRHRHLTPLLDGPHCRPDRRDRRRPREGDRQSRRADPVAEPLRRAVRAAGRRISVIRSSRSRLPAFTPSSLDSGVRHS